MTPRVRGEQCGRFLRRIRELQHLSAYRVAQLAAGSDDLFDSWRVRLRRYECGREVPSPGTLMVLAQALKFPWPGLLIAAQHWDILFGYLAAASIEPAPDSWPWPITPRGSAFERLFVLFPGSSKLDRDDSFADFATVDRILTKTCALQHVMSTLSQIIGGDGDHVKRCWPYNAWVLPSVVDQDHLIYKLQSSIEPEPRHPIFVNSRLGDIAYMSRAMNDGPVFRTSQKKYMAVRAERCVSMTDAITETIFGQFRPINPHDFNQLSEALDVLATETLPWPERCAITGLHIHAWADSIDSQSKQEADRARRCLYPFEYRKITEAQYNSIRATIALQATLSNG